MDKDKKKDGLQKNVTDRSEEPKKDVENPVFRMRKRDKKKGAQVKNNPAIVGKQEPALLKREDCLEVKEDESKDKEIKPASSGGFRKRKAVPNISLIKRMQEQKLKREEEQREAKVQEEAERKKREAERAQEELRERTEEEPKDKSRDTAIKIQRKMERMSLKRLSRKEVKPAEPIKKEVLIDKSLKSPIICILGHVDTGKTKILDKLRESNIQEGEAGGITQQIGATYFPISNLIEKYGIKSSLPGMLVIDTPGHESFSNLRSRGSSLCNLAILVVDIFHLLEPQTLESIELLKLRKTPFVVALNKIDRIYGWKSCEERIEDVTKHQKESTKSDFRRRVDEAILGFAEIGFNTRLYNENPNPKKFLSMVPTSAITGEGLGNLVNLCLKMSEKFMKNQNTYSNNFECVLLEVKVVEGFGYTIDVILIDGELHEGDRICVCGIEGPIVTKVKSILVPHSLKEMRVKNPFKTVKHAKASLGLKIVAPDLERVISGSKVLKVEVGKEEEAKHALQEELNLVIKGIKTQALGVHVQASTLGSLEALASFLEKERVPVSNIGIGNIKKTDVVRVSTMKENAIILCFDVSVDKDILDVAKEMNVKIMTAKIIYHLIDQYRVHIDNIISKEKTKYAGKAVFPCALGLIPTCIFTKRSPLVVGVEVLKGKLKIGTPVFVKKEKIERLGRVVSIENNRKSVDVAFKEQKVAIKIDAGENESPKVYGKHFDEKSTLYSLISRGSIDVLKTYFREELSKDDLKLIVDLKEMLDII